MPVGPGLMKPVFVPRTTGRAAGWHQAGDHSHSGWPDFACWRIRRRRGRFGGHRRGVPGSPPRARRHTRPHQRAGPDGLGRLRQRDTSGSGRRCHDARGHAAQQPPFDCQRGGVRGQAARRRRTTPRRRRLLGRRRPRQRNGHPAAGGSGRTRVQEFSCAFGRRGIPARGRGRLAGGASGPRRRLVSLCLSTQNYRRSCAIRYPPGTREAIEPGSKRDRWRARWRRSI